MHTSELITEIPTLGKATLPSPVQKSTDHTERISFVSDQSRVLIEVDHTRVNRMVEENQALPCLNSRDPGAGYISTRVN